VQKTDSRALTRHHADRVKKKRSKYTNAVSSDDKDVSVGKTACTPALCSCYMCGNPRKFFSELTMQEKKFEDIDSHFDNKREDVV
jgi:hypothetical protein